MESEHKLNVIQVTGILLSLIGLIFVAFPTFVGIFAIRLITFLLLIVGIYGLIFASMVKSKLTTLTSALILIFGFYAFSRPENILFLIGVICLISGINSFYLFLKTLKTADERAIISASVMVLLGVFAIINAKAALSTIIMIVGIIIVALGLIVFFLGNKIKPGIYYYKSTEYHENSYDSKIIVPILSDDVEEIEFKDLNE